MSRYTEQEQAPLPAGFHPLTGVDNPVTRRQVVRWGLGGASALSVGAFLEACGGSRSGGSSSSAAASAPSGAQKKGGTLIFGVDQMTGNLEPGSFATFADWMGIYVCAVGLTYADYNSSVIKPALATAWEVNSAGDRYVFHLRKGLTFHDGSPLTAHDFERSWKRLFDPKDPTQAPGTFNAQACLGQPVTKSFKAVDDYTFQVDLMGADVSFPARAATVAGVALSNEALKKYGKNIGPHLVGAGPFKYTSFTANQNATFERFDKYYDGPPFLDKVIMQIIPDPTAMTSALQSGAVQVSDYVSLPSIAALKSTVNVSMGKSYVTQLAWMNTSSPAISDLRVRKAINYALDRNALISQGFNGQATLPGYIVPPADVGYSDSLKVYSTQNLALAKSLVKAAGATGRTINIIAPNNRWWPTVSQIVVKNLQAVGLNPQVKLLDQLAFGSAETTIGKHEIALDSFSGIMPDPDDSCRSIFDPAGSFATAITAGDKLPNAKQINDILTKCRQEKDPVKRGALYVELQKTSAETQMVLTILAATPAPAVAAKNVVGLDIDALANYYFYPAKVSLA